jgi:hypothetical protein
MWGNETRISIRYVILCLHLFYVLSLLPYILASNWISRDLSAALSLDYIPLGCDKPVFPTNSLSMPQDSFKMNMQVLCKITILLIIIDDYFIIILFDRIRRCNEEYWPSSSGREQIWLSSRWEFINLINESVRYSSFQSENDNLTLYWWWWIITSCTDDDTMGCDGL